MHGGVEAQSLTVGRTRAISGWEDKCDREDEHYARKKENDRQGGLLIPDYMVL